MGGNGRPELHAALHMGHVEVAGALLERGADIGAFDPQGRMPIHVAAEAGSVRGIVLTLRWGASLMDRDGRGGTVLDIMAGQAERAHRRLPDLLCRCALDFPVMRDSWIRTVTFGAAAGIVNRHFPPEPLPTEFAPRAARSLRSDGVWLVRDPRGNPSFIIVIENQSSVRRHMPLRMMDYLHAAARQWRRRHPREEVPLLGFVASTAPNRWTAPTSIADPDRLPPPLGAFASGDMYRVFDTGRLAEDRRMPDEPAGALLRLLWLNGLPRGRLRRHRGEIRDLVGRLDRMLSGAQHSELRMIIHAMVSGPTDPDGPQGRSIREGAGMSPLLQEIARAAREEALVEGQREGQREGRLEGQREGRLEGQLTTMAGEKEVYADRAGALFGADAGRAVREHLRGVTDPDRLHDFGRKSLGCDTLEQLMALVAGDTTNGLRPN